MVYDGVGKPQTRREALILQKAHRNHAGGGPAQRGPTSETQEPPIAAVWSDLGTDFVILFTGVFVGLWTLVVRQSWGSAKEEYNKVLGNGVVYCQCFLMKTSTSGPRRRRRYDPEADSSKGGRRRRSDPDGFSDNGGSPVRGFVLQSEKQAEKEAEKDDPSVGGE